MARLAKRLEAIEKAFQAKGTGNFLLILPWDEEPTAEELAQYEADVKAYEEAKAAKAAEKAAKKAAKKK